METATVLNFPEVEKTNIFERAVCLSLELHRLGVSRKVNVADLKAQANVNPDALHVSKRLLEAEELQAIARADGELRRYLERRTSGPALFRTGVYMLSYAILPEVDKELQARLKERADSLVPAFLSVYDRARKDAEKRLGDLFDASEYPDRDAVRDAFTATFRYFTLGEASGLQRINADIFEREKEKAAAQWATVLEASNAALAEEFQGLVSHLVERLEPGTDGTKKRFNATLVDNLNEFLTTFMARNIGDSADLQALVDDARKVLAGVTADRLRNNRFVRKEVADAFAKIKTAADSMVEKAPRRYNLAD